MKNVNSALAILASFLFIACDQGLPVDQSIQSETGSHNGSETSISIFKEMSNKVKELHQEDRSELTKRLTKNDGTNGFDDVIKEIQAHDAESGGQVSSMIETILGAAEKEMGIDMAKLMKENLEQSNEVFKQVEGATDKLNQLVPKETSENVLEGLQDFIRTGGENGGIETWLQEFVNHQKRSNPESVNTEWMKKMERILNNSEKSFQKETENLLMEMLDKNMHLLEQLK